jgi:hypothetical protein
LPLLTANLALSLGGQIGRTPKRQTKEMMKNTLLSLLGFTLLSCALAATAQQFGDFTYSSDGSAITITRYTGPGGVVIIPATITSLPVTAIGDSAFQLSTVTSVAIPSSVTNIGVQAFYDCPSLTSVTVPNSVTGIGGNAFRSCASLTSVTIPDSVISIGNFAFNGCASLTNLTIPGRVTDIGNGAFFYCPDLQVVFFKGNAPSLGGMVFDSTSATIFYLPGTTGWGATFAGRPVLLWNPLIQSSSVGPAGFGFNITGTADIPFVVEAATNLANAAWVPLQSLNLTNSTFYFSDPNWTNYPARLYRIRSP